MIKITTSLLLVSFIIVSCQKESDVKIWGKWEYVERFDGYIGGNNQWNNIPTQHSHTLVFSPDGKYEEIPNLDGIQLCAGTYTMDYDINIVEINSTCNLVTLKLNVSELSSSVLIIDYQGREGIIRKKYTSIN